MITLSYLSNELRSKKIIGDTDFTDNDFMLTRKLLLIEDSSIQAKRLIFELEKSGFDVNWTRTLSEAKKAIEASKEIDIILSDFEIEEEYSTTFFTIHRTYLEEKNIPFVIMSAHEDPHHLEIIHACRPHAFLSKPVLNSKLLSTIENILGIKNER